MTRTRRHFTKLLLVLSVLGSLVATNDASAEGRFYDANDLLPLMRDYEAAQGGQKSNAGTLNGAIFLGYVVAIHDNSPNAGCPDRPIRSAQVAAVVSKHLKEKPEEWSEPADEVVLKALKVSLKCVSGVFVRTDELIGYIREYQDYQSGRTRQSYASAFLTGFIAGIHDSRKHLICPRDPDFSVERAVDVVIRYIQNRPSSWGGVAAEITSDSLISVYDCARK
jgi:Rap1a immunity proteins